EADLLLHVTDAADPDFRRHIAAVDQVLDEILLEPRPPRGMVFNKSDKLTAEQVSALRVEFPDCIVVSAVKKDGLDVMRDDLFARSGERLRRGAARRRAASAVPEPTD